MSPHNTSLRRTLTTILLALGLCLIGPAAAFAQGVEHGGLNFTIVSDDIAKTANGSVPEVNANSSSSGSEPAASGGGQTSPANTGSEYDPASGGSGGEAGSDPAPEPASEPASENEPASEPAAPESDADTYQSAADLNEKGKSGQTSGKKKGQR